VAYVTDADFGFNKEGPHLFIILLWQLNDYSDRARMSYYGNCHVTVKSHNTKLWSTKCPTQFFTLRNV